MNKINVLDSCIYNLISAGEVIERPASVVKELVENAIDAGAKSIKIEITSGGKTRIRVTDDGAGMSADDLEKAFLPHATSKITNKDDLFSIKTLGFRGEALASIAAVGMVTAVSKTAEEQAATQIELQGGKIISKSETSGVTGTTITVENLFYATPARLKFLKRDKSEETEITGLVSNLILSNPSIAFTYFVDGKQIFKTQGDNLKNALFSVYNREITMNFIEIENTLNGFSISGYISQPTYFKGNRSYQTAILNGRIVENKTIATAVEKAYEPFMMKRSYPLYVLNISMPYDMLDVNVHPSKFDVRFVDNHAVFSFIYHSVQNLLMSYDSIKAVPQIEYVEDTVNFHEENLDRVDERRNGEKSSLAGLSDFFKSANAATSARDDGGAFYRMLKNRAATEGAKKEEIFKGEQQKIDYFSEIAADNEENQRNIKPFDFEGKVIGQVFDTYILVQKGDNLYVIDQHAAHERMLYDKLCNNDDGYSQPLLIPYIYTANPAEFEFIGECVPQLNSIGFDICEFSSLTYKVSAVPDALTDISFDKFFAFLTHDLIRMNVKTSDVLKEKLMQTACKCAIKAGDALSNEQLDLLIKAFADAENKPLQCPHGRPTVIKIPKSDFEKWFKRIV